MSQKVFPNKSLSELFLERVIRIEPVQRERALVAKKGVAVAPRIPKANAGEENVIARLRAIAFGGRGKVDKEDAEPKGNNDYAEPFFELGFVPGRGLSPLWPVGGAPTPFSEERSSGFQMPPAMERAWLAALEQWLLLSLELREGKLITTGIDPFGDTERKEINPAVYLKDGLWFKVWENAIYAANHHGRLVKSVAAITVREAARDLEVKADHSSGEVSLQGAEADRPAIQLEIGKAGRPTQQKNSGTVHPNFTPNQVADNAGLKERQREASLRLGTIPKAEFDKIVDAVNPRTTKVAREVASNSPEFEENPPPKFGRILWPRLLADQVAIRGRGELPAPADYLDYIKARIERFFGVTVTETNESNLRLFKKAVYDGATELPWVKKKTRL